MAPDLNSVPASPRNVASTSSSTASSRRVSRAMAPPPVPSSSIPEAGPRDSFAAPRSPSISAPGAGQGPGPLRHPRPLTSAELHLELEKEQEAVVNRLTRELDQLRQQTASVASTTSSTSTGAQDQADPTGHTVPASIPSIASRRHRSSSNLSAHSVGLSSINSTTVSGIAPARDTPSVAQPRGQLHRQDSLSSTRRSELPSASSSFSQGDGFHGGVPLRHASSQSITGSGPPSAGLRPVSPSDARQPHRTVSGASSRFEEVAHQRAELDSVRLENEALRRRVQELERQLNAGGRRISADVPAGESLRD